MKLQNVTRAHAEKHYEDLSAKPFFPGLCEYSACPSTAVARALPLPPLHLSAAPRRRPVPPRCPLRAARRSWRLTQSPDAVCSGPVVAMVWQGKDVVKQGRAMIGATNPLQSTPGTIRGDFCIEVGRNVIHGSDAVDSAQREIALWFPEGVCNYTPALQPWIYE